MLPCSTQGPVSTATQATPLRWGPAVNVAQASLFPFFFTVAEGRWREGAEQLPTLGCLCSPAQGSWPCATMFSGLSQTFKPKASGAALWPCSDGQKCLWFSLGSSVPELETLGPV